MDVPIVKKNSSKITQKSIAIITLVMLVLFFLFLQIKEPLSSRSISHSEIIVSHVQQGDFFLEITGFGELIAKKQRIITAPSKSIVEELYLKAGAKIEKGTVILKLTNLEIEQDLKDAELAYNMSEAQLKKNELEQQSELLRQRSLMVELKSELLGAQLDEDAYGKLAKKGIVSEIKFTKSQLYRSQLQSRVSFEKERFENMKSSHDQNLIAFRKLHQQRKNQVEFQHKMLNSLTVKSSITGIVQSTFVDIGQRVSLGEKLAKLVSDDDLLASLKVPQKRADQISIGDSANIDTRRGIVKGTVSRIVPVVKDGTITVEITLPKSLPLNARPNLKIEGKIISGVIKNTLFVERVSHSREGASSNIFKINHQNNSASITPVKYGLENNKYIQIIRGLNVGDKVIVSDVSQWKKKNIIHLDIR
jgi:multidrug resistance efflux pump